MVMGPDIHKRSEQIDDKSESLSVQNLRRDVEMLSQRSQSLSAGLPTISEIVAVADRKHRHEIRTRISECEGAVEGEIEALSLLRKEISAKEFRKYEPLFRDACERRLAVMELANRDQALSVDGSGFPVAVPVISKTQTAQLLQAFHGYRNAYWARMYKVPAIQQHVLGELRAVSEEGRCPSLIVHTGTATKIPEDILRKTVGGVVEVVEPLLRGAKGRVSRRDRDAVASLLLSTPISPEKLNRELALLKKGAERLAELETRLKCSYGSVRVAGARKDPIFQEWRDISQGFGGDALRARKTVSELLQAQAPYIRIRQYLTAANLPFVKKLIGEYPKFRHRKDDIIQEGAIGFMQAIEKFDPSSGFALLTYAGFWVRQCAMRGFERESQLVAVPSRFHVPLSKLRSESDTARRGSDVSLAKKIGVKTHEVKSLRPLLLSPKSIDQQDPVTSRSLASLVPSRHEAPEHSVVNAHDTGSIARRLSAIMQELPERERIIMVKRFGLDGKGERTLLQLGTDFGLTRERVRQLQNKVLQRLREGSMGKRLREIAEDLG